MFRSEYDVILAKKDQQWVSFYLLEIQAGSPMIFKAIKKIMFLFRGSFKSESIVSQHC